MDQNIVPIITFHEATLSKNIIAPRANVKKVLGDLNLETFLSQTLRHDRQMINYQMIDFDEIEILSSLKIDCLVNGLNFSEDIMRKDILKNVFNGTQIIANLITKDLKTPEGTYIQGISVLRWLKNLVFLDEPNEIFGTKSFKNVQIQSNVHLDALLNSFLITEDYILTRSSSQIVKAKKIFERDLIGDNYFEIKNLKHRGFLDGINITEFLKSQVRSNTI